MSAKRVDAIEDTEGGGEMRAINWPIGCVWEFLHWAVLIAVVGVWHGFFLYVGWFAARGTFPDLIPWVQGLLTK